MGKQPTNSGIDYQQRIAAWCLINQYTDFDISIYFDQLDELLVIEKVHFETDQPIDDINISCKNNKRVFLQVKRTLSLSTRETSDFYKTIRQFVKEFLKPRIEKTFYGIVTTSDASSKITSDLKKIALAAKLSSDFLQSNPFNESEKDCFEKTKQIFDKLFQSESGKKATDENFKEFLKKTFVSVIDIESGNSVEIASFMLLKSVGFKNPELIWSVLIKNSLLYSSERLSIDKNKLKEIFDKYLNDDEHSTNSDDFFKTEVISMGEYSAAKEVLIIKSFVEELDYLIVELFRFNDDCGKKNIFTNDKLLLGNGNEWEVIQRFATMTGLERYLEEIKDTIKDKKVAFIPANGIEDVEDTNCAKLHKNFLDELISKNENPILCLHCGKAIGEDNSLLVELDDNETKPAVGNVHKECLRKVDRVLGTAKFPRKMDHDYLDYFDYKLWVSLLMKGQGMLNGMKSNLNLFQGKEILVGWNSNEEYDAEYSYCLKFILEDGSTSYAYQRGRIVRLNKSSANEQLDLFERVQKQHLDMNDPYCILSISKTAGKYSELLKVKTKDEVILEIKSFEISKYSKQIAKGFDTNISWYTPICLIRDKEEETMLNLSNVVPLLSDPLNVKEYFENWQMLGFSTEKLELKIIKSDKDFDNYMRMIFGDEMVPIIDPLFDKNKKLAKGYVIHDFQKMKAKFK
jgi:hypothetical protein